MDNLNLILTAVVLLVTFGLFISNRMRVDLVSVCVLVALLVLGLVTPEEGLSGFGNPATATIGAMFVVGAGLVKTGIVQKIVSWIDRLSGKSERRLVFVLCIVTAAVSAFLVNTAVVAILIPVVISLTAKRKIASSRVLIPLSYASQFGGVCTLIGSSTNILVNGIGISRGMASFTFFEFAPLGLVMVTTGLLYLVFLGRWLLPKRKGEGNQIDKYRLADYQAELMVLGKSELAGKTWEEAKVSKETGTELINLLREGEEVTRPTRTKIRPGDLLLIKGNIDTIISLENAYNMEMIINLKTGKANTTGNIRLVELLIPPGSTLIGQTIDKSNFFRRYEHPVLAIQRRGATISERLGDTRLESGDTLLIHGHDEDIRRMMDSTRVIVTNELPELNYRKGKTVVAVGIMAIIIILTVTGFVPIMVASVLGALGMVVTRCLSIEEAYRAIDWKIIFLLGGIIPLGLALENNGVIQAMVDTLLHPLVVYGPVVVLAVIYIIVSLLSAGMSNNALAAIMAPIAFGLAEIMNVDARPFLIAIMFAASTCFATPIGYQTNTMVFSAGGYRFTDFARIGIPLNILYWVLAIILIPVIWPF